MLCEKSCEPVMTKATWEARDERSDGDDRSTCWWLDCCMPRQESGASVTDESFTWSMKTMVLPVISRQLFPNLLSNHLH